MTQSSRAVSSPPEAPPAQAPPPAAPPEGKTPSQPPAPDPTRPPTDALDAVQEIRSRLSVMRWFVPGSAGRRGQAERVASALIAHARNAAIDWVAPRVQLLSGPEGVAALREGRVDLMRPRWQERLMGCMETLARAIQAVPRARHHSLFEVCGDSVSLRPEALPIPQERLWQQLAGASGMAPGLPPTMIRELLDRTLWEIGGATGWELMRDHLDANPFLPLLVIYEEGLYPLDLTDEVALLWAPGT